MPNFSFAARKLSILSGVALAVTLVPTSAFAQVEKYDIAGVRVGMSLSATKAAIANVNPKYEIIEKKDAGKVIALLAVYGDEVDQFIAVPDDAGVVWHIGRWQKPSEPMLPQTLDDALRKKYGTPSDDDDIGMGREVIWPFDWQGKQVSKRNCRRHEFYIYIGGGTQLALPIFPTECGGVITASYLFNYGKINDTIVPVVTRFSVEITDAKSRNDQIAAKKEATAREQQLRRKETEEKFLKVNPPTL